MVHTHLGPLQGDVVEVGQLLPGQLLDGVLFWRSEFTHTYMSSLNARLLVCGTSGCSKHSNCSMAAVTAWKKATLPGILTLQPKQALGHTWISYQRHGLCSSPRYSSTKVKAGRPPGRVHLMPRPLGCNRK